MDYAKKLIFVCVLGFIFGYAGAFVREFYGYPKFPEQIEKNTRAHELATAKQVVVNLSKEVSELKAKIKRAEASDDPEEKIKQLSKAEEGYSLVAMYGKKEKSPFSLWVKGLKRGEKKVMGNFLFYKVEKGDTISELYENVTNRNYKKIKKQGVVTKFRQNLRLDDVLVFRDSGVKAKLGYYISDSEKFVKKHPKLSYIKDLKKGQLRLEKNSYLIYRIKPGDIPSILYRLFGFVDAFNLAPKVFQPGHVIFCIIGDLPEEIKQETL